MFTFNYRCRLTLFLVSLWACAPVFGGYTLNTLVSFNGANGSGPGRANLVASGNALYGTSEGGGTSGIGEVFSVPQAGGTLSVLGSFTQANGQDPRASLTLSGSTLYGTTYYGGAGGDGTVFSVPVAGGTPTVLASLSGSTGYYSLAGVVLSGNTLYGTTSTGGANNFGTVFSVPSTGGTPTVLASFSYSATGAGSIAGLTVVGNTLYGTTSEGGPGSYGTVFSLPLAGGAPTVLASFNGSNGGSLSGGLILVGSTLYGTARDDGPNGYGDVFSVPLAGGTPTVLASFNNSNGANPESALVVSGSTLFGTTYGGGANGDGTVFSVPLSGGAPTVLATFNGSNGNQLLTGLTIAGNTFYGVTQEGGANGDGTVFSLTVNPAVSFGTAVPTAFGSQLGTLHLGGGTIASASFPATSTGYLAVSGLNPSATTETFALDITDSVPANLSTDLAALAAQLNAGTYTGYTLTDSTGMFGSGYDFFITVTDPTAGSGPLYIGFDLTQLNGTTDTLTATAAAAVPEPTALLLLGVGGVALLGRRCSKKKGRSPDSLKH